MKKKLHIDYPWLQLKKGQGFFVPCLDTEAVKQDGLRNALRHRVFHPKANIGVKNGLIGVWFHR
jgi:hypothetical protein